VLLAPLMLDLIGKAPTFLEPRRYLSDPDHYACNLGLQRAGRPSFHIHIGLAPATNYRRLPKSMTTTTRECTDESQ
jgi:hypothetical protein